MKIKWLSLGVSILFAPGVCFAEVDSSVLYLNSKTSNQTSHQQSVTQSVEKKTITKPFQIVLFVKPRGQSRPRKLMQHNLIKQITTVGAQAISKTIMRKPIVYRLAVYPKDKSIINEQIAANIKKIKEMQESVAAEAAFEEIALFSKYDILSDAIGHERTQALLTKVTAFEGKERSKVAKRLLTTLVDES